MATTTKLVCSLCAALLGAMLSQRADAESPNARFLGGTVLGPQGAPSSSTITFALKTPSGRETFRFFRDDLLSPSTANYRGSTSRRAGTAQRTPAALTTDGRASQVFFSSRRTGRPMAATIFHEHGSVTSIRVSKVNRFTTLPCGHQEHQDSPLLAVNGLGMYRASASEQPDAPAVTTAKFSPARILEVSAYADAQFVASHGKATERYMQATMNAAALLYMNELGIRVKSQVLNLPRAGARSERSYRAEQVLEEFRLKQRNAPRSGDLRHLFTGKVFNDTTIGLAYVATACAAGGDHAVGLSRSVKAALQPLVVAHELAHGLSAVHDATPFSLMNPAISPLNTSFSEATKADIHQFVAEAAPCLEPDVTPSVGLALSIREDLLTAEVPLQSWHQGSCTVTLQANSPRPAKHTRKGSPRPAWKTVTSSTVYLSGSGEVLTTTFSTISPIYLGKARKSFSFRSIARCGNSTSSSRSQRISPQQAGASTLTNTPTKDWLSSLISNFRKN